MRAFREDGGIFITPHEHGTHAHSSADNPRQVKSSQDKSSQVKSSQVLTIRIVDAPRRLAVSRFDRNRSVDTLWRWTRARERV